MRDRILAAAEGLFYAGGIHTVGTDRVIERAGLTKASLDDCWTSRYATMRCASWLIASNHGELRDVFDPCGCAGPRSYTRVLRTQRICA